MSRLVWVLLPLLLAAAWLAWRAWHGRMLRRLAMNVWFSLLLLVYLGTIAGLGIFWVANQHLRVFDWHYLFGYATLLLLAVHLAFNWRAAWHHLAAPHVPREGAPDTRRGRLALLGGVGLLAAAGSGYLLGLRHGRTELRVEAARSGGGGASACTSRARPWAWACAASTRSTTTRPAR